MPLPYLTQARAPLTCDIDAVNEYGDPLQIAIPAERALTVYVDKRELVTLMTLGAHPELLVLGYLRNQRLVKDAADIESITVDWDVGAAAVKTRHGIADIEEKTARKVVTTGCGQGSVFGGLMDEVDQIELPADACITQAQLYGLVNTIRLKETTYKSAGSVHACALFSLASAEPEMLLFVEDVGRHNAIDTIAGWMAMNMTPTLVASRTALPPEGAVPPKGGLSAEPAPTLPTSRASGTSLPPARETGALRLRPGEAGSAAPAGKEGAGLVFYTTGRLTSEMVIKSAQMGVPIVVSRSGITQMGHQVAQAVGLCAIGRATNRHFVCYAQPLRLKLQPDLAGPRLRAPETA
ncbi:MAG: formate dehydrogenase accessory sulfurtransferase FdhD [Polaromonas sp.]|uniref:formate dehydrogenase accessory sulfurtransferase FdhD n=1 Tax=Polaromonas sp. TaxID=1869339 RepID=UPI002715AF0E|nr:formate dehydrogenase accessory sulfurtransferase FdhD [Polaromonas sp.]MDO9113186.1 formate dehydrogenase accessory sulfurtransferase FdhD [Polaromonas sp.]MDP1886322.1 formate dehydrogenase accessory sulfurtransferase FdhD [Polaromonas sp.]